MANELWHSGDETETFYVLIWRKSDDLVWNNTDSTFDTYTDADILKYDVPLANIVDSDYHTADFPAAITDSALQTYRVQVFLQIGGNPDADNDLPEAQGEIYWDGTSESDIGTVTITNSTVTNFYDEGSAASPITTIILR